MCQQTSEMRLNDIVHIYIQLSGIEYVCDNYKEIREEYYLNKEQYLSSKNNLESEK